MTEDEARDQIIQAVRFAADWAIDHAPADYSVEQRISLAVFTLLAELDGVGQSSPVDFLVLETDDETGEVIGETRVSTMLHEYLYRGWRSNIPSESSSSRQSEGEATE